MLQLCTCHTDKSDRPDGPSSCLRQNKQATADAANSHKLQGPKQNPTHLHSCFLSSRVGCTCVAMQTHTKRGMYQQQGVARDRTQTCEALVHVETVHSTQETRHRQTAQQQNVHAAPTAAPDHPSHSTPPQIWDSSSSDDYTSIATRQKWATGSGTTSIPHTPPR